MLFHAKMVKLEFLYISYEKNKSAILRCFSDDPLGLFNALKGEFIITERTYCHGNCFILHAQARVLYLIVRTVLYHGVRHWQHACTIWYAMAKMIYINYKVNRNCSS